MNLSTVKWASETKYHNSSAEMLLRWATVWSQ